MCATLVACSMEDDILSDISSNKKIQSGLVNLHLSISTSSQSTKAAGATNGSVSEGTPLSGDYISSCYLMLLNDGGDIVYRSSVTKEGAITSLDMDVYVKENTVSKSIAVVNASHLSSELDKCNTLEELKKVTDTSADYRTKVGEGTISWNNKTDKIGIQFVTTSIVTKQITAGLDLTGFYVKYVDGVEDTDVRLTGAYLSNLKTSTLLFKEGSNDYMDKTGNLISATIPVRDAAGNTIGSKDNIVTPNVLNTGFNSTNYKNSGSILKKGTDLNHENCFFKSIFPNTTEKSVTLTLEFNVNGKVETRDYIINRYNTLGHLVEAGNWYRLDVIVTVTPSGIGELQVLPWEEVLIGGNDGIEFK